MSSKNVVWVTVIDRGTVMEACIGSPEPPGGTWRFVAFMGTAATPAGPLVAQGDFEMLRGEWDIDRIHKLLFSGRTRMPDMVPHFTFYALCVVVAQIRDVRTLGKELDVTNVSNDLLAKHLRAVEIEKKEAEEEKKYAEWDKQFEEGHRARKLLEAAEKNIEMGLHPSRVVDLVDSDGDEIDV
jgi:hypothetical protein